MAQPQSRRQFLASLGYMGAATTFIGRSGSPRAPFDPHGGVPTRVVEGVRTLKLPDAARHPGMCDFTPDGRFCFFTCQDTNNVVVIDRSTFEVDGIIPLSTADVPWDLVMAPGGATCYVSNSTFDEALGRPRPTPSTVTVIDVAQREETATIPVGVSPNGMLVDRHRNRLWVANAASHTVSVIDLDGHEVVAEIPVARGPFSLAQSPDGRRIVAVGFKDAAITVIDAASLTPGPTVAVGRPGLSEPHPEWRTGDCCYAAFSDNHRVWVSNFRTSSIRQVDLDRGRVTDGLDFESHEYPISVARLNERYGWVHGLGMLKLVDFAGSRVLVDLTLPLAAPLGPEPLKLEPKQAHAGGSRWELWMGVTPDSSIVVVPLDVPATPGEARASA